MKRCIHPNIVRLYEVMDDPSAQKIYLVLEFVSGGELVWKEEESEEPVLALEDVRRYFLDVVCGLDYCKSDHHSTLLCLKWICCIL